MRILTYINTTETYGRQKTTSHVSKVHFYWQKESHNFYYFQKMETKNQYKSDQTRDFQLLALCEARYSI